MSDGSDRRRFERFEIKLPGKIGALDGPAVPCEVRDYCSGGMLVQLLAGPNSAHAFDIDEMVALSTFLLTDAGRRGIQIKAIVAWVNDRHLGVRFKKPSTAIVDTLGRHDQLVRKASNTGMVAPKANSEGRCLAKIRHVAQGSLPALMRELLGQTLEHLLDTADRVTSDADRQQVYGDLSSLERLRNQDLLIREVLSQALDPALDDKSPDDDSTGELALVDTDDFERWLEASRAANLLERKFNVRLAALGSRLAAMRDSALPNALSVPFEPKNFTDALKVLAKQLELGSVTRSVLFERCVEVLGENLDGFYTEIETALDALGAPKGLPQQRKKVAHGAAEGAQAEGSATAAPQADSNPGQDGIVMSPEMAELMHAPAGRVDLAESAARVAVDARALEVLIERDRQQRESQAGELVDNLSVSLGSTESMAGWIEEIRGSLVKEAVSDPQFFHNRQHPLNGLLDSLGRLQQYRPTPDDDPKHDRLRRQINQILEPITRGETDLAVLRSIADSIAGLTEEQSEHYQRNVERVIEASEGRDRVRRARAGVTAELNKRYAGRRVPSVVRELLDVGWRALLELAALNAAEREGDLARQLNLLDSVVSHLGGEAFEDESTRVEKVSLLVQLSKELGTAAFDPFSRNAVESRLRKELIGPATEPTEFIEMPAVEAGEQDPGPAAETRPQQIPQAVWRDVLDNCRSIRLGDRMRFAEMQDGEQVLRVAWIRSDHELFTLVDHRGIRAREITLHELAAGVCRRTISLDIVDGRPLSGRAVDQMLEGMEDRLSHQASHDSLTGLINRRQFNSALEQAVLAPNGTGRPPVLAWVDIDQFKLINDMHGYSTGDRLLVAIAGLLDRSKGNKLVGHLGADRFAVLLSNVTGEQARQWAADVCAEVRDLSFDWNGNATALSVSLGLVSVAVAKDGIGEVLQAVERALAAAKTAGGDQGFMYSDDDPDIARQRDSVKWVARVDEALVDGELRLRCQPIVPVRPGEGMHPHYEVLLGVASGSNQALPIAEFIEAAERYKRMRAVDRWVTKTVFDWINRHRDRMPELHGFAINLSGQTASDPAFIDFVRQQFQRTGIDHDWVSFEVTETAAVASLSGTAGIIHELKRMGCKVALDDFGSGLASYSYLKELPVDWLKIDGVFVRDITNDREDYAVVKSINDIGHFLGKKTIAEYVKDDATLDRIREIGVDFGQGFGIARPMLMDDLILPPAVEAERGLEAAAGGFKD